MKAEKEKKHTAVRQMSAANFFPTYTREITFMMKKIKSSMAMAVRK